MDWKTLMICTGVLVAGSAGLVACGDDTEDAPCETDADCASGEYCIGLEGARECEVLCTSDEDCNVEAGERCIQVPDIDPNGATVCDPAPEQTECTTDTDCGTGGTCIDGGCIFDTECTTDADCSGANEICEAGYCIVPSTEACQSTADCIDNVAYCGEQGGTATCIDVSCGSPLNSCSRCQLGPDGGDRSSNGPVIFYPTQVGNCSQDPNQCVPGAAPWVCEFSFLAYGDNLPTSNLNNRVQVISSTGNTLSVFGTRSSSAGNNTQYNFRACFPDTSSGSIGTAVVLRSASGSEHSNSLCVSGTLPR